MEPLETDRLVLRPLRDDDVDAYYELVRDPEVMRFLGDGRAGTREDAADAIRRVQERFAKDGFGGLGIERREDGRLIGRSGLLVWDRETWQPGTRAELADRAEVEVGWQLARHAWGHGYATEAARAVVAWTWANLDVPHLISLIDAENTRSIRVAEKLGERYERDVLVRGVKPARLYVLER